MPLNHNCRCTNAVRSLCCTSRLKRCERHPLPCNRHLHFSITTSQHATAHMHYIFVSFAQQPHVQNVPHHLSLMWSTSNHTQTRDEFVVTPSPNIEPRELVVFCLYLHVGAKGWLGECLAPRRYAVSRLRSTPFPPAVLVSGQLHEAPLPAALGHAVRPVWQSAQWMEESCAFLPVLLGSHQSCSPRNFRRIFQPNGCCFRLGETKDSSS